MFDFREKTYLEKQRRMRHAPLNMTSGEISSGKRPLANLMMSLSASSALLRFREGLLRINCCVA